jgi:transcriptional regulator with GAF, ATPase, and Fis domain
MSTEDDKVLLGRAEEFLNVFKKGAEFTQEILKDNERLRFRVLELEEANRVLSSGGEGCPPDHQELLKRISDLEREKGEILDRIRLVEEENQDFATRYVEVETENNNLASLYIASYQLHSTLDFKEVLQIIMEIIINLIGAEEFAILLLDEKTGDLGPVATEGIAADMIPPVRIGEGIIGGVAQSGDNYFADDIESYVRDIQSPMVCISLKIKDEVIGVIVIYKLLTQKSTFADVDYELFTLLAGHAATAIFSSRLYSQADRKLSTMQGFIELLTK